MKIAYEDLKFIHPYLREEVLPALEAQFEVEFTLTSIQHDGNEVAIRCHFDEFGKLIECWLNSVFSYDPERPYLKLCIYYDAINGKNIHIRVHPGTVKR